jgi:hypothetical protein
MPYTIKHMYSGTTLSKHSGNLIGVHQKIDRTARKKLEDLAPGCFFPRSRLILSFEGNNGPDGIKRKSTGCDEPAHFYDPEGGDDQEILKHINDHYQSLVEALKLKEIEKSAFEAAWLAHSIVDGLTPAHHYPYLDEVDNLRSDAADGQTLIGKKLYIKGKTKRESARKNWAFWGTKGLIISHAGFEFGVASIAALARIKLNANNEDIKLKTSQNMVDIFKEAAQEVYSLNMFEKFLRYGWTPKLANKAKKILMPTLTQTVVIAWLKATRDANNI